MKTNSELLKAITRRLFRAAALTLTLLVLGATACAQQSGSIVAWGVNYGQFYVTAPNSDFVAADGGYSHSLGVRADGLIEAWGLYIK